MEKQHLDMVIALAKDPLEIIQGMSATQMHCLHMVIGMAGELGEVLQASKRMDRQEFIVEAGDFEFYFVGLVDGLKLTMESITLEGCTSQILKYDNLKDAVLALVDKIKKYAINNNNSVMMNVFDELSAIRFYLDISYATLSVTRENVLKTNFNKLSKRYDGLKYSDKAAAAKADQQ